MKKQNIDEMIEKESKKIADKITKDLKILNDKMLSDVINYKVPKHFNGLLKRLKE